MYAVREFQVGQVVKNEFRSESLESAEVFALQASEETENPVNVIDDEDEIVSTFLNGAKQ